LEWLYYEHIAQLEEDEESDMEETEGWVRPTPTYNNELATDDDFIERQYSDCLEEAVE